MASQDLSEAQPTRVDLPTVRQPGTVPDKLRQQISSFFLEVVGLRDQVMASTSHYRELAAAVQVCADEIDEYERAIAVSLSRLK